MATGEEKGVTVNEMVLRIDGRDVRAPAGATILEAAKLNGILIPTLCHLDGLCEAGVCRVCLVEVKGEVVPACVRPAAAGMEVETKTERVKELRRTVVELLFAERNHICAVCVSNGHCELQDLANEVEMHSVRVPYVYPRLPLDATHPRFLIDHNRCVLCGRCVRVCAEVEGAHTWGTGERGVRARMITDLAVDWGKAESCTGCGKCVQVCPTGAIVLKGKAAAEMEKDPGLVAELVERRGLA
jgi:bidirectional [NiFe] hydrogenase diaphorase subunit